MPFTTHGLYAVVHEAGYADGNATRWSAMRTMPEEFREDRTLLFGEHVFPWTFEDDALLAPLAEAADLLAAREWPRAVQRRGVGIARRTAAPPPSTPGTPTWTGRSRNRPPR